LVLTFEKGRTWKVTGIGRARQNSGRGAQLYEFDLQKGSDTIDGANSTFGWFNGRVGIGVNAGVISYSRQESIPGFGESCPAPNCESTKSPTPYPTVGSEIVFANDFSGPNPTRSWSTGNGRLYSVAFNTTRFYLFEFHLLAFAPICWCACL